MAEKKQLTTEEWLLEGKRRFGDDMLKWRFVCPVCGNVASPEDFQPYKAAGATPNSATCECIGRYTTELPRPCNYAGYGLFRLSPISVDGQECFGFAEPEAAALTG